MKPLPECLYYLIREMDGFGAPAKEVYFEDALEHIRAGGLDGMCNLEIRAVFAAAKKRGKLGELDEIVKAG